MCVSINQIYRNMEKYRDRIAFQYISDGEIHHVSFGDYMDDIKRFVSYLQNELPEVEGKHIAILAKNSYRYAVCLWGVILAKGIAVLLNIEKKWDELQMEMNYADVSAILIDDEYKNVFNINDRDYMLLDMNGDRTYENTADIYNEADLESPALMLFTSGSMGGSKCVVLSYKNIITNMIGLEDCYIQCDFEGKGTFIIVPFFHVGGLFFLLWSNYAGRRADLGSSWKWVYRDMTLFGSDQVAAVPALMSDFYHIIKKGKGAKLENIKLIWGFGAPMRIEQFETFQQFGIRLFVLYGLTENSSLATWNYIPKSHKPKSVGKSGSDQTIRIDKGEICIKGNAVMLGYYKNQEATNEVIQDGWLHTGDLGYLDEDGYLYISGRKKNIIILSNGENVSAEELEAEISWYPQVIEVIVKEKSGRICAEIFCDESDNEEIKKIIANLNYGKPMWKRISELEFRERPFPKNSTGKIIRKLSESLIL